MKESRYPLAINIFKFPYDVHLISLKSHFDACWECQVTVLKKYVRKKYWFLRKKNLFTSWIWTCDLLNASQLLYQLGYRCCCGFNEMLLSAFFFNLLQSANWTPRELEVINLTFADNKFMVLDGWSANVGSCRRVIGVTGKVRDISFINIKMITQ